jgi:hypothetical protein
MSRPDNPADTFIFDLRRVSGQNRILQIHAVERQAKRNGKTGRDVVRV